MKLGPNQQAWVDALRSGMYRQGINLLEDTDGSMCCLGVASSLAGCERTVNHRTGTVWYDDNLHLSPVKTVEFLALKTKDGNIPSIYYSLAELNDSRVGFLEIADLIVLHADELFSESK